MAIKKRTPLQIINKDIESIKTIINCISKSSRYSSFESMTDFENNEMAYDASIRQIEVIGEAIKRLSPETTKKYPEINWSGLAGMRDRLIHQYDRIDTLILWDTLKKELPLEIPKLELIKRKLKQQAAILSESSSKGHKQGPTLW